MRSRWMARHCRPRRPRALTSRVFWSSLRSQRPRHRSSCDSSSCGCGCHRGRAHLVSAVVATASVVAAGTLVAAGGPVTVVERGVDRSPSRSRPRKASSSAACSRLGERTGRLLAVAWEMARDEPLLGTGAGSFEAHWLRERPISFPARDAHNLYLETLAELGLIGLALLLPGRAPDYRSAAGAPSSVRPGSRRCIRAYLLHAVGRLALGDARRDAPGSLLRGRAAFLQPPGGPAADGQPTCCGARDRSAGVRGRPRRARRQPRHAASSAAIERREADPALAKAQRAIELGPVVLTSPGSFAERPSSSPGRCCGAQEPGTCARADPENWSTWLDLAVASRGAERARALARGETAQPAEPGDRRAPNRKLTTFAA